MLTDYLHQEAVQSAIETVSYNPGSSTTNFSQLQKLCSSEYVLDSHVPISNSSAVAR